MSKASWFGAIVLMGTLGLSVGAAAKNNDHDQHHEMRPLHDHDHAHDHMTAKERHAAWEKHERERRDHEREKWAKSHHHHANEHHPPQSAALKKPAPPATAPAHYHQYHRPQPGHVPPASPAQGK